MMKMMEKCPCLCSDFPLSNIKKLMFIMVYVTVMKSLLQVVSGYEERNERAYIRRTDDSYPTVTCSCG